MQTHTIETKRGVNIGNSIIEYLRTRKIYGKVEISSIDTTRNVKTRTNITLITCKPKGFLPLSL